MKNSEAAQVSQPESSKVAPPLAPEALAKSAQLAEDDDREDHYYDMPCTD